MINNSSYNNMLFNEINDLLSTYTVPEFCDFFEIMTHHHGLVLL